MKSVFCLCVAVAVITLGSVVGAQDLGSGNKLFGSPPAKKATVKNAAPKKSVAKPQTAAGKGAKPSPGHDAPLTPAAERLYETLIDDVAAI